MTTPSATNPAVLDAICSFLLQSQRDRPSRDGMLMLSLWSTTCRRIREQFREQFVRDAEDVRHSIYEFLNLEMRVSTRGLSDAQVMETYQRVRREHGR